jgi:hypothetical protein
MPPLTIMGYQRSAYLASWSWLASVINGCSDLIIAVYGEEAGAHSRSAIGAANLPLDYPVSVEAE